MIIVKTVYFRLRSGHSFSVEFSLKFQNKRDRPLVGVLEAFQIELSSNYTINTKFLDNTF